MHEKLSDVGGPSGTVTFLFTDIEGSTRLWQQDEEAMRRAMARHDELLHRLVAEHGGEVFSTMGDGLAAAFASASSAVAAALAAQRALAAEIWPTATPIRARMGLHTGEAERREGDYFGSTINRAARLMAVGSGGQVLCSGATAGLVEAEVALMDLGEHRLRDLDRPLRVFQVGGGAFAPLRSLDAFPGNLPIQLTSFVGRERELGVVAEALGSTRLVTLTGTGGVGKTRLALQAAAEALPAYPDGVWLCELAAAADSDEMLQVVAVALGLTPRQDVSLAQAIADFIGKRQLLVVLDNCEHLLDAAAELVETLLAACTNLRVLATSREALDVGGERVVRLRSLGVPRPGADLDQLSASDATRLFIERAEAAGSEVAFNARDAAAITEICRRLDGIPLAIELAAARVIALTPGDIAAHLDERFRLLTGRRAAVERHHTLRATVDWSYSLLNESERRVFDRLGVFPGSFDASAAEAVVGDERIEDWDVLDALTSLVAKSMLLADRSETGSARYQMLETLRHYARERLDASGSSDDRRRRHALHFVGVAEEIGPGLRSAEEQLWHERLLADLDNFRAAVFWGLDSADNEGGELAVRIIANLAYHGWSGPGVGAWAEQAVERARSSDPRYRGVVLAVAAGNAFYRGDFALARPLSAEALRDGAVEGSPFPSSLYVAPTLFARPAELPGVVAAGLEALERVHAPEWEVAQLRASGAAMAAIGGQLQLAEAEATAALAVGRRLNSRALVALALYARALACSHTQPDVALAALDEYVTIARGGLSTQVLARCLALSAQIRAAAGDLARALSDLRQAIGTAHSTGDRPAMAFTLARVVFVLRGDDPTTAAVLSGVIGAGVLGRQFAVLTWERDLFQHAIDDVRARLGDEPYQAAVDHGAALSHDDAVATALDTIERLSRF
jgi:predicted ATPase/class 3 adenylate cyclase